LNKLGKKDMVTVNGGLNLNYLNLLTNNPSSVRAPNSWYANGNINVGFLGWSFPFSYQISNQSRTYSQPFNQYAIAPTYKWIKVQLGWTNITLSPYSLSGYPLYGAGCEFTPNNWKIVLLYGQLKKAVPYNLNEESSDEMSYKRVGFGGKIGYNKSGYEVSGHIFKAKDIQKSLPYIPENINLFPQEGLVTGIGGKFPLGKKINVETEITQSILTRNYLSERINLNNFSGNFMKSHITTQNFKAYKSSINYNERYFSIAAHYERIDPGYMSLGAFFFNNDLENYTLAPQIRLFKNKLNLAANAGMQKNNLDQSKLNTTTRWVGSGSLNFVPNSNWILSAGYSNFTNFTRNRPNTNPFYTLSPADTLFFYQVSQNSNVMAAYNFTYHKTRHNISIQFNQMNSSLNIANINQPATQLLNGNLAYAINHTPSKQNIALTANFNTMASTDMETIFYGPGLSYSKSMWQNTLQFSLGSIFNQSFTNGKNTGLVFSERLSIGYQPKVKKPEYGKPVFSLSGSYVNKPSVVSQGFSLSEFTGNINIGYHF